MTAQTILFANNAASTLAAPITNSATALTLAAGTGALFPQPAANQYFVLTLVDAATGLLREIVHVTAVSGDTLTIVRGQEGTTARAYNLLDPAANLWTAGQAAALLQTALVGSAAYLTASDELGGVSAIQPFAAGNPNGFVAGNAATGSVPPSMVWDEVNQIIWVCVGTGTSSTAVWIALDYQEGIVWCGTSTGTANAQILTPVTPIPAYASGLAISFVAGFTNTGAMTVNVSSKGSVSVYKEGPSGPIPLTGGEIVAGNIVSMRYDGVHFQLTASELGTASLYNTGNTVVPINGQLETASPFGAVITGTSHNFVAADRGYSRQRSNSTVSMTDTLPAVATLADGWWIIVINEDISANDIISAPAGATLNNSVGGSITLAAGQSVRIGFNGSGFWVTGQPVTKLSTSQFTYVNISNAGQVLPPGQYQVDSSGGKFMLLLELSPVTGDNYSFKDFANAWGSNPITLSGNGALINGTTTWNLDVSGSQSDIVYFTNWISQ